MNSSTVAHTMATVETTLLVSSFFVPGFPGLAMCLIALSLLIVSVAHPKLRPHMW